MITKLDAIKSLAPDAQVVVRGDELEWIGPHPAGLTDKAVEMEHQRLQAEYERNEYQRKRAAEYPPFADYLDAVGKGDAAQVQAYKDACLAVKAKYPKPE